MANRNIQNQRYAVNQIVEGDENYIRVIFSIITIWDETIYQNQINNNFGNRGGDYGGNYGDHGNQNIDADNQNIDADDSYPSVLAVYNYVNYRENGLPSIDRHGNVLPYIPLDIIRDIVEDQVVQRI